MKKTAAIHLSFALVMAGALTACEGPTEERRCVDNQNRVVEEAKCTQPSGHPHGHGGIFFWHYGGVAGPNVGDTVVGGNRTATPGRTALAPSRGGFGSRGGVVSG